MKQNTGVGGAIGRALTYLLGYRRDALGAFVALLLVSAANLLVPLLIQRAIDLGIGRRDAGAIVAAVAGLVGVAVVRGLFTFAQGFLAERASQGVAFDLRETLFAKLETLSFSYYDRAETGQLITRLTNDVEQVRTFVGNGVVQLLAALLILVGTTVLLFVLNWRLALVALLIVPPIGLLLGRFVRRIGPLFGGVQRTLGKLNSTLQENLAGLRVVRAFGREPFETARYRATNEELREKNITTVRAISNNFPFVGFLANLGTLAVIWYGGLLTFSGGLTIGELVAFNTYLTLLVQPILTIGFLSAGFSRAGASASRVFEIVDAPLGVEEAPDAKALPPIGCRVELRDVWFHYLESERDILRGVSFVAEPGQTVAVLGGTGSGKSTLVNLIPRFYDVTEGEVLIDGYDVRDVTLSSLRSQIGVALQETLLFGGTVRDNIAYGKLDASSEAVRAAARAAQADGFIRALPKGYDTVIGERGVGLSGGQRQRIAIARALLVDPKLLILDDSTSAVDAETEAAIQAALAALMKDSRRTVFVIAQRISTVRNADVILVLENGVIAARGTHEELSHRSPLYNDIVGSQLRSEPELVTADGLSAGSGARL